MHRMRLSWVTCVHDYHQQLQICNTLPISFENMRRDAMLFYKLYIGPYDVQFYDHFSVSAERRCIHVLPTYKFKKLNLNSTFTEKTARLLNVFLNQSKTKLIDCESLFRTNINLLLFASVKNFSVENTCSWFILCNCSNCRCSVRVFMFFYNYADKSKSVIHKRKHWEENK